MRGGSTGVRGADRALSKWMLAVSHVVWIDVTVFTIHGTGMVTNDVYVFISLINFISSNRQ